MYIASSKIKCGTQAYDMKRVSFDDSMRDLSCYEQIVCNIIKILMESILLYSIVLTYTYCILLHHITWIWYIFLDTGIIQHIKLMRTIVNIGIY